MTTRLKPAVLQDDPYESECARVKQVIDYVFIAFMALMLVIGLVHADRSSEMTRRLLGADVFTTAGEQGK